MKTTFGLVLLTIVVALLLRRWVESIRDQYDFDKWED